MYLISYDMSTDKLRNKVAKTLENYGRRVQYSVFECDISKMQMKKLYGALAQIMQSEKEGSIRVYTICSNCSGKLRIIGGDGRTENRKHLDVIII